MTSPNTFILTLGVIQHWFKDTDITKKTGEILKKLQGKVSNLHVIGDAASPRRILEAVEEGFKVAKDL